MTIARIYRMQAAEGRGDELAQALADLATIVTGIAGCHGADLIRDVAAPEQFLFIEKWDSIEAHKAGGAALPKGSFAAVGAAMAGPPESAYGTYL
jgi:quinol monooxygenase YgiN